MDEPRDTQSPEEIAAHIDGVVSVAWDWICAVRGRSDWRNAWRISDDNFRLCRSQAWLWSNQGSPHVDANSLERLARSLARRDSNHRLWADLAKSELKSHQELWDSFWGPWDESRWGAASRPRPVTLDYELVLLAQEGDEVKWYTKPTEILSIPFLMHRERGEWRVANAGAEEAPIPGWPPYFPDR